MNEPAIEIRRATPADAASLAALRHEFRAGLDTPVECAAAFVERCSAWMAPRLGAGSAWLCWIAERNGEIVGQLWLQLVEKLPNPVAEREHLAYITNLYLRPAARRQGLGSRLLSTALEWCSRQDVDSVILWPTPESRPLYSRFGFRDSGDVWETALELGPGER